MMDSTAARREWSAVIVSLFPDGDENVFPLIERAIDKELASTTKEEQLWREETLMVDLVSEFVRITSAKPLARLAPVIKEIIKEAKKKKEDLEEEAMTRWVVASSEKMFQAVLDAVEDSPRLVKGAIKHLYAAAKDRFPCFEFRAVGALVGLRCYCPAIVSPELYALVKPGKEISIVARKALVRIAKLLQNVFNETGVEEDATSPEPHQHFIRSCIPKFHSVILSITEGRRLSEDIHESGHLPGSPGQESSEASSGSDFSSTSTSTGTKTLGRMSLFSTKKRTKSNTPVPSSDNLGPQLNSGPTSPRSSDPLGVEGQCLANAGARLTTVRSADDVGRQTRFRLVGLSSSSPLGSSDEDEGDEDGDESSTGSSTGSDDLNGGTARSPTSVYHVHMSRSSGALVEKRTYRKSPRSPSEVEGPTRVQSADSLPISPVDANVLARWSTKELSEYLHKAGFSEDTRSAIKKGKVTGETLLKLDHASQLHSLGIVKLGERKRLLKLIREANEATALAFLDRVDMVEWSVDEVVKWAVLSGFEEYQGLFLARGVNGAQLMRMDHAQLSDLGISKWGIRQRIIRLIDEPSRVVSPRSAKNRALVWTVDEVLHWLKATGMEQYQALFAAERVAGAELLQFTEAALVQIGVTSLGHRKRLLRNIAILHSGEVPS